MNNMTNSQQALAPFVLPTITTPAAASIFDIEAPASYERFDEIRYTTPDFRAFIDGSDQPVVIANNFLDVVFVGTQPHGKVTRTYFVTKPGTDEDELACFSNNGDYPDPSAKQRQADTCAACRQNVKGSGMRGEAKACGTKVRAAIIPVHMVDPDTRRFESLDPKRRIFRYSVTATNMFAPTNLEQAHGMYSLNGLMRLLGNQRYMLNQVVVRITRHPTEANNLNRVTYQAIGLSNDIVAQYESKDYVDLRDRIISNEPRGALPQAAMPVQPVQQQAVMSGPFGSAPQTHHMTSAPPLAQQSAPAMTHPSPESAARGAIGDRQESLVTGGPMPPRPSTPAAPLVQPSNPTAGASMNTQPSASPTSNGADPFAGVAWGSGDGANAWG